MQYAAALNAAGRPAPIPLFRLVIFLSVETALRVARLNARERLHYGDAAIAPGGPQHDASHAFVEWASGYETGALAGCNRKRHEAWLARLPCPVLRLEGASDVDLLVRDATAVVGSDCFALSLRRA